MTGVLVDSNVLLDIATQDPRWGQWSENALANILGRVPVVINPIIFAEVSVRYPTIEELNTVLPETLFKRHPVPFEAAFLAGKVFEAYRRRGGKRTLPLPDFFIGAHAAVTGMSLLTRDAKRYRREFPSVELITP